jgi:purine-cytosine permease-like protein
MISRMKGLNKRRSFKKEFKIQVRLALAAAVGFIIAFAWKDYILFQSNDLIQKLAIVAPYFSRFLGALFITLVGVLIIFISSKILR